MKSKKLSSYVDVKVVTWLKDSYGLFDYESQSISHKKYKVENSSNIYREGDSNIMVQGSETLHSVGNLDNEIQFLFSIKANKGSEESFTLVPEKKYNEANTKKNPFLVVRSLTNDKKQKQGYELEAGDVIRFGRIEYRVLEYRNGQEIHSVISDTQKMLDCPFDLNAKDCHQDGDVKKQCKICLMEDQDMPEEILINPCKCKGSSEYVHIKCLQNWISMKRKKKEGPEITCSYWKRLNCELCKTPLPDVINFNGEKLELLPIDRPETPYIILERLYFNDIKEKDKEEKMVIQLTLANSSAQIKLGRGHDCDIREEDISVSRFHAYMKFQNNKFVIFDNNSKFGTLVLFRRNQIIDKEKVALQIGKVIISFCLKQPIVAKPSVPLPITSQSSINKVPLLKTPILQALSRPETSQISRNNNVRYLHLGSSQNRPVLSLNNLDV